MTQKDIRELANWLGYDLIDLKSQVPYNQRKGLAIGIRDRRSGKLAGVYSTWKQVKDYLETPKE